MFVTFHERVIFESFSYHILECRLSQILIELKIKFSADFWIVAPNMDGFRFYLLKEKVVFKIGVGILW